jgi:trk system potassium uptake protein TrkA
MRCVVIGIGQVGIHVARSLADNHEVVVVDTDEVRLDRRKNELDVLTVEGDGAVVSTLREADVDQADMVVACTADDKTNIVACGMSKILGNPFTIARVNRSDYLESWREGRRPLGVDFMVGANDLTARRIAQHIGLPAASEVDFFASGRIQLAEFNIPDNSPIAGKTIQEMDETGEFDDLNFMAVFSGDGFEFPRGDSMVRAGDQLLVAGSIDTVHRFSNHLVPSDEEESMSEISIFGAGEIGFLLADTLEASDYDVQLIESDPERSREVAEVLPNTLVLNHDATDGDFLMDEHIDQSDVVIATLDSDEKNLLVSVFAKKLGANRAISVVEKNDYVHLFEDVGIDVAINPRLLTAEEISRHTIDTKTENIAILESENVEVLEVVLDDDSSLVGNTVVEAAEELPRDVVFGPIMRRGELISPRGDTKFALGDHVLILVHLDQLETIQDAI